MSKVSSMPRLAWRRVVKTANMALYPERIDAVLVSYPKSGRTWFRFILSSYLARAFDLKITPDLHSMFSVMPNFDSDPVRGLPAFAFGKHQPRPPLVPVSHLPYSRLRFRSYPAILMVRDPRDVMVSSYFHATRQKHRFSGDLGGFLKDPEQGTASLTRYLNGWSAGLQYRKHIVVSYEKLTSDPHGETSKVLAFLGVKVMPQLLTEAVEAANFKNMRELEQATGLPGHDYDRNDNESLRMRRGKVGGFADYLSDEQISLIDHTCRRELTQQARTILQL
jgi:hypothetical protein